MNQKGVSLARVVYRVKPRYSNNKPLTSPNIPNIHIDQEAHTMLGTKLALKQIVQSQSNGTLKAAVKVTPAEDHILAELDVHLDDGRTEHVTLTIPFTAEVYHARQGNQVALLGNAQTKMLIHARWSENNKDNDAYVAGLIECFTAHEVQEHLFNRKRPNEKEGRYLAIDFLPVRGETYVERKFREGLEHWLKTHESIPVGMDVNGKSLHKSSSGNSTIKHRSFTEGNTVTKCARPEECMIRDLRLPGILPYKSTADSRLLITPSRVTAMKQLGVVQEWELISRIITLADHRRAHRDEYDRLRSGKLPEHFMMPRNKGSIDYFVAILGQYASKPEVLHQLKRQRCLLVRDKSDSDRDERYLTIPSPGVIIHKAPNAHLEEIFEDDPRISFLDFNGELDYIRPLLKGCNITDIAEKIEKQYIWGEATRPVQDLSERLLAAAMIVERRLSGRRRLECSRALDTCKMLEVVAVENLRGRYQLELEGEKIRKTVKAAAGYVERKEPQRQAGILIDKDMWDANLSATILSLEGAFLDLFKTADARWMEMSIRLALEQVHTAAMTGDLSRLEHEFGNLRQRPLLRQRILEGTQTLGGILENLIKRRGKAVIHEGGRIDTSSIDISLPLQYAFEPRERTGMEAETFVCKELAKLYTKDFAEKW